LRINGPFLKEKQSKQKQGNKKSSTFQYPPIEGYIQNKKQFPIGFKRYLPIILFDLMALTIVLLLTYEFSSDRLIKGLTSSSHYLSTNFDRVIFYASIVFLVLTIFGISNLYKHDVMITRAKHLFLIIKSFLITAIVVIIFSFLFLNSTISESFKDFLVWFTLFGIAITFTVRLIFRYLVKSNMKLSTLRPAKKVIIIGAGQAAKLYAAHIRNIHGINKLIFLDDDNGKIGSNILGYPVIGNPEDVSYQAIRIQAEEICIIIHNIKKERLLEIIQYCKRTGLPTKVLSSHYNLMFTGMYKKCQDLLTTIPLYPSENSKIESFFKRSFDIVGAIVIGITILIPCLIIAMFVKLSSSGPVFHQSFRVGKRGKLFKMIKFRSMCVNSEEKHEKAALEKLKNGKHMGKVINDPRITNVGFILRKFSLDELPQIINVLRGDMSLVGPRPCFDYEMKMFEEWHHRRFLMKPGITGLWQITGRQMNNIFLNDAMTTDVFYTDNYSIWMDFRILFKTIPVVLLGKGQ